MAKQLKPVKRFRRLRLKTCGNCKFLQSLDHGMRLKCARPSRRTTAGRPWWQHHTGNYADEVFGDIWQHVCDRWAKKAN